MPDGERRPAPVVCDVPVAHFPLVFPAVRRFIERGLEEGGNCDRYRIEDVLLVLIAGQAKLWVAYVDGEYRAAMCTQIVEYPRCSDCRIWFIAGEKIETWFDDWVREVEAYARAMGCLQLATCGREGWIRKGGGRKVGVEMVKRLRGEP